MKLWNGLVVNTGRVAGIAALVGLGHAGVSAQAQTAAKTSSTESPQVPEWQKAAGGKLSFEVASIKQGKPGTFTPPNFALNNSDSFGGASPHGHFVAGFR
jgi:hypothetical protein